MTGLSISSAAILRLTFLCIIWSDGCAAMIAIVRICGCCRGKILFIGIRGRHMVWITEL